MRLEKQLGIAWRPQHLEGEQRDQIDYSPDSSRRARAVDVWAALKSLGRSGLAELVERHCRQAAALSGKAAEASSVTGRRGRV